MHVILPGYAIPLRGLFCVVFHCFVLQISVGSFAVCYIVVDYFSAPGSSSPVSRTTETLDLQGFPIFLCAEIPKPYPNDTQSSHVFNEGLHPVCRFAAHGVRHMTVAIQGERRGIVAHVFLQGLDVVPCPKAVHCEGMAQIVHPVML